MQFEMPVAAAVVGIIAFIILFLRIPAYAVMFSLLVGQVLSMQASSDVYAFVADISGLARYEYVQAGLIVLPVILTGVFLRGKAPRGKIIYEFLPAVFASLTLLLLLYPHVQFVKSIIDGATNDQIESYRGALLIIASVLGLISVWISFPKHDHKNKNHK